MKTIAVSVRAGAALAALSFLAVLAGAGRSPAADAPRSVAFVNDGDQDISVHVRTGPSGELGTCAAKPSENTFELRGKDRREVDAAGNNVCWCSRPSSEGPINERRDCEKTWKRVDPGDEVHVR